MKNKNGSLSSYIILLILIILTAMFYLTSLTFSNSYLKKQPQTSPSLISPSPTVYPSPILNITPKPSTNSTSGCRTEGCSGQLCVPIDQEPVFTTCEYKEEYSCLKYAVCEKQANGTCGFTQTTQYLSCINDLQNQQIGL